MEEARLTDAKEALKFILAGNALITLKSPSGNRYTYKIQAPKEKMLDEDQPGLPGMEVFKKKRNYDSNTRFVNLLTGQDNESSYTYIGIIDIAKKCFRLTDKSKMTGDSLPVKAIGFTLAALEGNRPLGNLEIWRSCKCGRCGKTLTVDESIKNGYGPECYEAVGIKPTVDRTPFKRFSDCKDCATIGSSAHNGSARCKVGSIASGGNKKHCTCETCF